MIKDLNELIFEFEQVYEKLGDKIYNKDISLKGRTCSEEQIKNIKSIFPGIPNSYLKTLREILTRQ
jgi:hypothetical protein